MQLYSSQIVSKNLNGKLDVEKTVTTIKDGKQTVTRIKNGRRTVKKLNGKSPMSHPMSHPMSPPMLQTSSISPTLLSPFLTIIRRRNPIRMKKVTKKRTLKDSGGKRKKQKTKIKSKNTAKKVKKTKKQKTTVTKKQRNWFEKIFDV